MNLLPVLKIMQMIVSVLLVCMILLQAKGTGLSATFGGEGFLYTTKRGFEKFIFYFTIFLAISFSLLSLACFLLE